MQCQVISKCLLLSYGTCYDTTHNASPLSTRHRTRHTLYIYVQAGPTDKGLNKRQVGAGTLSQLGEHRQNGHASFQTVTHPSHNGRV